MSVFALSWHDDEDPRDLPLGGRRRLGARRSCRRAVYLLAVHEPDEVGEMDVVTVELAPIELTPDAVERRWRRRRRRWSR